MNIFEVAGKIEGRGIDSALMDSTTLSMFNKFCSDVFSLESNKGIFVTGSDSSGKSYLLDCFGANSSVLVPRLHEDTELLRAKVVGQVSVEDIKGELVKLSEDGAISLSKTYIITDHILLSKIILSLNLGCRVICRQHTDELMQALQDYDLAGWSVFDVSTFKPDHNSVVDALIYPVMDRLNDRFRGKPIDENDVEAFVKYVCEEIKENFKLSDDEDPSSKLLLGQWASAFARVVAKIMLDEMTSADRVIDALSEDESIIEEILTDANASIEKEDILSKIEGMDIEDFGSEGKLIISSSAGSASKQGKQDAPPQGFNSIERLKDALSSEVLGQDVALKTMVDSLTIPMANMHIDTRPLRSMILLGPTGVGKTKVVETLAKNLYTEEVPLIRIDMSEYNDKSSATKLFGSPPGYIGYGEDGPLVSGIKKNPYSIVLLDEAEKAAPVVWDAFLSILDNGIMTTGSGEHIDMRNTVIVLTSNIGTQELSRTGIGFGENMVSLKNKDAVVKTAMKEYFRPEFINRLNNVIVFDNLSKKIMYQIAEREILNLGERASRSGFTISKPSLGVVENIVKDADIATYGAREIQRLIDKSISLKVAQAMTNDKDGKHLVLSAHKGDIRVSKRKTSKKG